MSITATGILLIFFSVIILIFRRKYLYDISIFSIPFSATAIINSNSGFWLTPFHYFGFLWIFSYMLFGKSKADYRSPVIIRVSIVLLLLFSVVAICSIFMSEILSHEMEIRSYRIWINEYYPLELKSRNLTAVLYLLFGITFSISIYLYNDTNEKLIHSINLILASLLFVCLWGYMQFISNISGYEYPYEIFNNTSNELGQGYKQLLSNGLMRVSSVSTEPSIFAQFVISISTLVVFLRHYEMNFLKRFKLNILIFLSVVVLVLSTSTTAYIGLLFLLGLYVLYLMYFSKRNKFASKIIIFSLVTMVAILLSSNQIWRLFNTIVIDKLLSGSGQERFMTIKYAFEYFLASPILGLGWGSVTSHDLLVKLLANTGVVGAALFLTAISILVIGLYKILFKSQNSHPHSEYNLVLGYSLWFSFLVTLLIQFLTGFIYYQGLIWFILGANLAIYRLIYNSTKNVVEFENLSVLKYE